MVTLNLVSSIRHQLWNYHQTQRPLLKNSHFRSLLLLDLLLRMSPLLLSKEVRHLHPRRRRM